MTWRAKRFAAGLALAAGLVAVGAACSGKRIDAATAVRQSDLRFLPKETAGLVVVEVARFEDRAAIGRWLDDFAKQSGTGGLDRVRAALGPDALERLDRLSLALVPVSGSTSYAVLAEGRFEEKTVKNLTGGGGIVTLVEVGTAPDLSIMPLPKNHLALGPRAVLERVQAASSGGAGAGDGGLASAPVMKVLSRVDPAKQIWGGIDYGVLSGLLEEGGRDGGGASPMSGFARSLRALAFQGAIDKEVEFDLIGLADGEPGAKTLADAARGLVAIARVGASQGANRAAEGAAGDPALESARAWLRFLDHVRIDQERDEIRVHGTLDGPMARSLAGAASKSVPGIAH